MPAFAAVIWPSSAARTRTSTSSANSSSLVIGSVPGAPAIVPCSPRYRRRNGTSSPSTVMTPPLDVGDRDDAGARCVEQPGRRLADVAEALDRDARTRQLEAQPACGVLDRVDDALAGRVGSADRAADRDRLAGDDAGDGVAAVHRDGVHDPGHRLGVGPDVGRRDVRVGPDDALELGREPPRRAPRAPSGSSSFGSQVTPPFAPPNGTSTRAHFQVIHIASARTSSRSVAGWKRRPPLAGPRATLCWTR